MAENFNPPSKLKTFTDTYRIEIVLIVVVFITFFIALSILELNQENIKNSLLKKQADEQLINTQAIALSISSNLALIEEKIGIAAGDFTFTKNLNDKQMHGILEDTFQSVKKNFPEPILNLVDKNDTVIDAVNYNNLTLIGKSVASREDIKTIHATLKPQISDGSYGLDGKFRIAVSYPILDPDKNLIGIIRVSTPSDLYFGKYVNSSITQSQFLVVLDNKHVFVSTPTEFQIGHNFFSDEVQSYLGRNNVQNRQFQSVFAGTPSAVIYNFNGEKINTGYPVSVDGRNYYFVFIITPTESIYAQANQIFNLQIIELAIALLMMSAVLVILIIRRAKTQKIEMMASSAMRNYMHLFNNSPELCRVTDKDGKITDCNQTYATSLGYSKYEVIGVSVLEHSPKDKLDYLIDSLNTWKTTGAVKDKEIWLKRKNGTVFPALLSATAVYNDKGNLMGSNTVIKDMTEIHAAHKKVEEERTKRLMAIGELSARIAHDLRNPLSVIKNTINIMNIKYPNNDEKINEYYLKIDRAISRMTHQIDEVLDYVKPKPLHLEKTSINEVLNKTLERITIPAKIKIIFPETNTQLICDIEKMEIVIANIIANSIQAMKNEGIITIRTKEEDETVNIEIEDTGTGIPPDFLEKIFDPLFTTRQVGTGLGLVSCKNIVESHGGTIAVKTTGPKGTTFLITLPKLEFLIKDV